MNESETPCTCTSLEYPLWVHWSVPAMIMFSVMTVLGYRQFGRKIIAVQNRHHLQASRMRYIGTDKCVVVYKIEHGHFHIFLSHAWQSAADKMRVAKSRLLEMAPEVKVFLE